MYSIISIYTTQPDSIPRYKISENYQPQFEEKRDELKILIADVRQILEDNEISLKALKFFLNLYQELRKDVRAAQSLEDVMTTVYDYTSLINTKYLKAIAKNFKLQDKIDPLIKTFDDSIIVFCKMIPIKHIYGQDFMKHSHKNLQESEEVKFVLEWDGDETTLRDIQSLLKKAFRDEARHVMLKVVNEGNSIIFFCYAPPHLHEELKRLVTDNERDLRNMKVLSVSIGGFEIIEKEMVRFSVLM